MNRLLLLLLCATLSWAESPQERGKRVVDEALTALGGSRFLAVESRIESGRAFSFYREEISGLSLATIYTKYVPPSGNFPGILERQSFGKKEKEETAVLFADGAGYQITFRGARPLPDETLERYRVTNLNNVLYILRMRRNEPGLILESRGQDVWLNQPVEIVDIIDSENRVVTVYFHQSTKFPVRQVFFRRDPKTKERIEEVTEFGRYRDSGGGVFWPYTMQRTRDGQKIYELFSDSVTHDQPLSDSLFTLPAGIKMLKKER
jgi:hypothetical protein